MAYSNSSLVSYTRLDPNRTKRKYPITRITPHCVVGQWTAKRIVDYLAETTRDSNPSVNYGVGCDGKVALGVPEDYKANTSSSSDNDHRAVTIECASDTTHPYAFRDITYKTLIDLCVDICRRNGKTRLIWIPNKSQALAYTPAGSEMLLTVHRWFDSQKACPGDWMMNRMGDLAAKVTARLQPEKEDKMTTADWDKIQKMIDTSIQRALAGEDSEVSEWAKEEFGEAVTLGITDGSRPRGYAKREEVAIMVRRSIKPDNGKEPTEAEK